MKSNYEKTLDENFDKALNLCSNEYFYEELIELLKNGNIPEKQYSALMLKELKTQEDAEIFLSNLINCDGKIREAVAHKFTEFVQYSSYREFFAKYPNVLAKATIDINANISRMVIDGLALMKSFNDFGLKYAENLVDYIKEAFDGLDKIVFRDKKYTVNKQLFKLYWCLEGLNNYYEFLDKNLLKFILKKALEQNEYTVREKVAQILTNVNIEEFDDIRKILELDDNYYVKRILNR